MTLRTAILLLLPVLALGQTPGAFTSVYNALYVMRNGGTYWDVCQNGKWEIIGSTKDRPFGYLIFSTNLADCDKSAQKPREASTSTVLTLLGAPPAVQGAPNRAAGSAGFHLGYPSAILPLPFPPIFSRDDFLAGSQCDTSLRPVAYVVNHGSSSVSAVSACTGAILKVIGGIPRPLQVALTPDASTAIVTSYDNRVAFIDTATNTVNTQLLTDPDVFPNGIAITPDGAKAYVTSYIDVRPAVIVIDLATRKVVNRIAMPNTYPHGITFTPDGSQAWVRFLEQDVIVVLDTQTNTVASTITSVRQPVGLRFDSFGTRAYVASYVTGFLYMLDTASYDIVATVKVGLNPIDVGITPNGRWVFVTNGGSDFVSVIDADTATVVDQVPVGFAPFGFTLVQ